MNYKQLVFTGITTALILSNFIIGDQYIRDAKLYESKIKDQGKEIKQINRVNLKSKQEIKQKTNQINDQKNQIDNQNIQINQLNDQLNQFKNENDNLKKQLQVREEMRKSYYTVTFYTNGYESTQKKAGDSGYGVTASGTKATAGRTIAAPKSIPFGTKVYIEGIGTRVVEDRGGAIADGHIDVFVNDVNMARSLGKQTLLVEILD